MFSQISTGVNNIVHIYLAGIITKAPSISIRLFCQLLVSLKV